MQSAPTEASPTATSVETTRNFPSSNHHGLPDTHQSASEPSYLQEGAREPDNPAVDTDTASVSSGGATRGRQPNAGRISTRNDSSQESSPGSRIDEYERANARTRKPSDGMIFQVIPNSKGGASNVSIQDFPNGAPGSLFLDSVY